MSTKKTTKTAAKKTAATKATKAPAPKAAATAKPKKAAGAAKATKKAATPKAPQAAPAPKAADNSKRAQVLALLGRDGGATSAEIAKATGWQNHTIRGFMSVAKKAGHRIESLKNDAGDRTYRIPEVGWDPIR